MMETKRVIIATESYVVNQGFHLILKNLRHYQLIGKANNLGDLLHNMKQETPDIILISTNLLTEEGAMNQLLHQMGKERPMLIAYLTNGAKLQENRNFFSHEIHFQDSKEEILATFNAIIEEENIEGKEIESSEVSEREKEILKQVALGLTNNEIAERLFISAHTVITHRKKITKKLGIKSVSGLTVYAIINGLVEMEDIGEKV